MVDFHGFHVGKYTVRPMDPSWGIFHGSLFFGFLTFPSRSLFLGNAVIDGVTLLFF